MNSLHRLNVMTGFLLVAALVTLLRSVYVPVYGDELIVAISGSRGALDGWRVGGVWIRCPNNFSSPIPLALLPGRMLAWLFYLPMSTPLATRLAGITTFVCWITALAWATRRFLIPETSYIRILSVVISLSFIGLLPFMAVLTRPETYLAIAISCYAFLPYALRRIEIQSKHHIWLCTGFLLLSSWFYSVHPKALFFTPLVMYAFYQLKRAGVIGIWSTITMALIIFQSVNYWNFRMECSENESMHDYINLHGLQPELLFSQPLVFITRFFKDLAASPKLVGEILFMPSGKWSYWLPTVQAVFGRVAINLSIIFSIFTVLGFWVWSIAGIVVRASTDKQYLLPYFAVPILLLQGMITSIGFQGDTYFYNAEIWLIGCCLTLLLLYQMPLPESMQRLSNKALRAFAVISFLSQISLVSTYWVMPQLYQEGDEKMRYDVQELASPFLDYSDQIIKHAAKCNIDPKQQNTHLVVDRFTYFAFFNAYRPIYIEDGYLEDRQQPLKRFMKRQDSSGLIAVCSFLPGNLKHMSIIDNGLCCISKERLFTRKNATPDEK